MMIDWTIKITYVVGLVVIWIVVLTKIARWLKNE